MGVRINAGLCAALFALLIPQMATAQQRDDIRKLTREIEELKISQGAMLKELQEIKSVIQAATGQQPGQAQAQPAAPAPGRSQGPTAEIVDMVVNIDGAPSKGDKNAKLTVVEFTDYQCPFCSRHFRQTWPRLEQDYVNTGKVRFILRDLPIEAIHPQAFKAAEAAYCAGAQGKFWEMHDQLFLNQSALNRSDLTAYARTLALDVSAFDKCVDSGTGAARIKQDVAESAKAGARGTPIFYVGLTDPNNPSQVKATRIIRGAHSYNTFRETFEGLLSPEK